MKDISTALKAHIRQGVTTLAGCIEIRRRDGRAFYFTDHDEPITIKNNRYLPYHSFARTSIPTSLDLDVDSSEFHAILNSAAVVRDDVAAGLFDYAEVAFFLCNYMDPTQGTLDYRKGWMGEVETREDGTYTAEIRGLTQILVQRLGLPYSPECRVDLGSPQCGVAVNPARWQAERAYSAGQIVSGITAPSGSGSVTLTLANGSFDADPVNTVRAAPTGWTPYGASNAGWNFKSGAYAGLSGPSDGSQYTFMTHQTSGATFGGIYQDVDLVAEGIDATTLDTGLCRIWTQLSAAQLQTDQVYWRYQLKAIDGDGVVQTVYDSGQKRTAEDRWIIFLAKDVIIPAGTRYLRIDISSTKKGSDEAGTAFDGVKVVINLPNGQYGGTAEFGNVAFVALTDGVSGATEPSWGGSIDDETVDGSITWRTIQAFRSQVLEVEQVVSQKSYRFVYLTDEDAYYDGGLLYWETGRNAGHSFEVMSQVGNLVTMFQRPFYPVEVGDTCVLYPGCDKRFTTCVEKFDNAINFRGEPFVPGQDEYYKTPNAHLEE